MSRRTTDVPGSEQECSPSPPLPADHVLNSGAVLFPGAFDQHGCPLIVFPADAQARLSSDLSKAEVADFINYFLCLHNKKKQEQESLVSVVADLRQASLQTTRFIGETLLLLELHKRTVHSLYVIQPRKKEAAKLLLKLLAPAKSRPAPFKKVLLKEIPELSNHVDRSQLTPSLGGYLIYCHQSWVAFIKEIDAFVQEFLSVVQRLPSCISALQDLSRLPLSSTCGEPRHLCSTKEAKFQQLRRELGLDELLRRCDSVVEKLRCPEKEPCYQDMAGTALFVRTASDMLQNHSRITAAVEKVELLWQQLQLFRLRADALQITEQMEALFQEKLHPYRVEIARDAAEAGALVSHFEASVHAPAMALVCGADDVIRALADVLPTSGRSRERWVVDLQRLKEKLRSAVHAVLHTLRAVSSYHRCFNKASSWYGLALCENFLQELLSGVHAPPQTRRRTWGTVPAWRRKLSAFLKKNPPPDLDELGLLARLSHAIPDEAVRRAGGQMSERCMTLRKLLISSGPVSVGHLQQALQWQYELFQSSRVNLSPADGVTNGTAGDVRDGRDESDLAQRDSGKQEALLLGTQRSIAVASAECKPPSLSSFDSGFDGAGSGQPEAWGGRGGAEGLPPSAGTGDFVRPAASHPRIHRENVSSVSDPEELDFVGNSSGARIHIIPKVSGDSLNLEIKVKRSAAPPSNPWLSLPVDDLENSYTVTITHNATPQKKAPVSGDEPAESEATADGDWTLRSQSSLEDPEFCPVGNILSSTIADAGDKSVCTTEGVPTLLWDSYDLHDQNQHPADGVVDISQEDWDEREQEGLREVEEILGRTDEILEEEEKVLAQEAVLEALLRSEVRSPWPPWDSEDPVGALSEADDLDPAESRGLDEPQWTKSAGEADGRGADAAATEAAAFHTGPDLLTELRMVHVLDELIAKENLKLRELRRENPDDQPPASKPSPSGNEEREAFRLQVEKEKREVEKLERSLDAERAVKKRDGAAKVVKCWIMDKATSESEEDRALCEELLSQSCVRRTRSDASDQNQDACEAQSLPGAAPQSPGLTCPESAPSGALNGASDWTQELEVQPQGCVCGEESQRAADAPLSPDMRLDDGVFDPGGETLLPPEPAPRKASLPANADLAQPETPHSTEPPSPAQDPGFARLDPVPENVAPAIFLDPDVNEQLNNNNNNRRRLLLPEKYVLQLERPTAEDEEDSSVDCVLRTDSPPAVDIQTSSSSGERPHPRPLEFDRAGGVRRTSGSGSPGTEAQLDVGARQMIDFSTPIVLDTGSGLMKAGFADQDRPNVVFPTIIGTPKYEEVMNGNFEREMYIGSEAQHMRGVLALKRPIKNGIVRNWDDMEKIWHHAFQQLRADPEDHPVLLTEAAMTPLENRQRAVEIMFECFCVPLTYVAMQAVLALYAAGRTTGVVFDSGDGVSHSVPVFEGYSLPHAVQRFPLAGADVTLQLRKLLQEQGVSMCTTAEVEIVREMKEKCCCVALDYEAQLTRGGSSSQEMHYTMPDGQVVTLGTERFRAPEILFKPELIGRDHYGMHESVFKSILVSDIDLRRCLLGNIVLSGGNTLLPGLPERLQAEIRGLVPAADMGVRVTSPRDRDFSVWSGGAVLANLPSFDSAWITQEEYCEFGPQIVLRKCF